MPARLAAALAVAAGAAAIAVAVLLLRATPGPERVAAAPAATPAESFPAPPRGAFVLAREAGTDAVALAVVPGAPFTLQASVVGPSGSGRSGLRVVLRLDGRRVAASPCGAGCYAASGGTAPPRRVVVELPGASAAFALPPRWPPAPAATIVARAERTWRSLDTLVSHERLASSPTNALHTVYRFQAPDRLSYAIRGGSSAVVVGRTRWDRGAPGAAWQRSPQTPPLRQPSPFWASAVDAHVVEAARLRGRAVWRVSFFDPRSSAWFLVAIDRATYRTLDVRMVAASHFMHDVYGPFDAPFRIVPPS